jgi:hypothetical protein
MTLNHLAGAVLIIALHFEIENLAIALRGLDTGVAEQVLDRGRIRI